MNFEQLPQSTSTDPVLQQQTDSQVMALLHDLRTNAPLVVEMDSCPRPDGNVETDPGYKVLVAKRGHFARSFVRLGLGDLRAYVRTHNHTCSLYIGAVNLF